MRSLQTPCFLVYHQGSSPPLRGTRRYAQYHMMPHSAVFVGFLFFCALLYALNESHTKRYRSSECRKLSAEVKEARFILN